jgi:NAD dependent epimerase/dehydratase
MHDGLAFWHDKNVLVTGAGGFIGSHLVEALAQKGARVRAFVRYNSRGDPGLLRMIAPELKQKVEIVAGDLRDLDAVKSASRDIAAIFHLGALIAIPYSYKHPVEVVQSNILGTLHVLLAGRESQVGRIVHTSTSEVYGSAIRIPIDENHPLQGQSPYSASKIGADKLAESFYCAYDLPVVTIRPFNTFGPRQSARAVIPSIIIQAAKESTIHLGNLEAFRDFTYVTDTVVGMLKAGEVPGIEGKTFNLGVGDEIKIIDLAHQILSIMGKNTPIEVEAERLRPVKSEVTRLLSDNRLARKLLNWKPQVSRQEGLERTIDWIVHNFGFYSSPGYQI